MQAHFRQVKPKKTAAQAEAQRQALLQQIPEQQRKGLSDSLLSQALDMGMVGPAASAPLRRTLPTVMHAWLTVKTLSHATTAAKLLVLACMLAHPSPIIFCECD